MLTNPSQDLRIPSTLYNSDRMFSKKLSHALIHFKMEVMFTYQNLKW